MNDLAIDRLFAICDIADDCRRCPSAWLSRNEAERWREFGDAQAALRWLAGRYGVKKLLERLISPPPAWSDLHVESRDASDNRVRPVAYCRGRRLPWSLSLSHGDEYVYAAAAPPAFRVGVDVVEIASVAPRAIEVWFTPEECQWRRAMQDRPEAFALIWSLKEAWYKAENRDEPFRPLRWNTVALLPDAAACKTSFDAVPEQPVIWDRNGLRISIRRRGNLLAAMVVQQNGEC